MKGEILLPCILEDSRLTVALYSIDTSFTTRPKVRERIGLFEYLGEKGDGNHYDYLCCLSDQYAAESPCSFSKVIDKYKISTKQIAEIIGVCDLIIEKTNSAIKFMEGRINK